MELLSLLHDPALKGPHDVEVVGDHAYVAGKWGAFSVVDVSDPLAPEMVGSISSDVDNAQTILPMGDVCLLGTNDLLSIDVTNPADPSIIHRIGDSRIDRINGMVRRGHTVYAANKSHFIDVFDISSPSQPVLLDAYDTESSGVVSPHDVALWGDWLITVDQRKDATLKVQTYRVWDDGPIPCERWVVGASIDEPSLNGANRVAVNGKYAYVACNYGDSVCAIELLDSGEALVRQVAYTHDVAPCGIELGESCLYVGAAEHVEKFDLGDPAHPTRIDVLSVFNSGRPRNPKQRGQGDAHDLVLRDDLLYVTGQNDDSLAILKT